MKDYQDLVMEVLTFGNTDIITDSDGGFGDP